MKVVVTKKFHDINAFSIVHNVGDVISVDEERGNKLIKLGICNLFEEEKPIAETPKTEIPTEDKEVPQTKEGKPIVVAPTEEKKEETPKTPKEAKTEKK